MNCLSIAGRLAPHRLIATRNDFKSRQIVSNVGGPEFFVTCHPGLEHVVAQELKSKNIGACDIEIGKAGVAFRAANPTDASFVAYNACLWLRAAIRVLGLLQEFNLDPRIPAGDSIYDSFRESIDWTTVLKRNQTFSVDSRIYGNSNFSNSQLVSKRARDAICDSIRDRTGDRPMPPEQGRTADVPLFVTAFRDTIRVYRDYSGSSLHRRGYRSVMHAASLNEAAAAGCLYLSGWADKVKNNDSSQLTLVDPMCGSGTFLIEASLMATNTAPGLYRKWWPFTGWVDADGRAWREAIDRAKEARQHPSKNQNLMMFGNDIHSGALSLAMRDIKNAEMDSCIRLHHGHCRSWELPTRPSMVITNPPWGMRLMGTNDDVHEIEDAWSGLGTFLKRQAGGCDAFILSGSTQVTQFLKLRADKKIPVTIGGVDCRLLQYHIRGLAGAPKEEIGSNSELSAKKIF